MKKLENKAEYLPLSELVKLENNPRTIKKADFEKLKDSIKSNPDYFEARPIICSDRTGKNVILGGNQRYEAAKALGIEEVPVIVLHGLDEAREREIVIRDNVSNGDWDFDILANEWDESELEDWGIQNDWQKEEAFSDEGELGTEKKLLQCPACGNINEEKAFRYADTEQSLSLESALYGEQAKYRLFSNAGNFTEKA